MSTEKPDWYLAVYGQPITGAASRGRCPAKQKTKILELQGNRCLYCDLPFGSTVLKKTGRAVQLKVNWDHFVPYVYARRNKLNNWVAACHICNGLKSCSLFTTVNEARDFILYKWEQKGYSVEDWHWPATIAT